MKHKRVAATVMVATITMAACGGGGGGANSDTFADLLQDVCREIDRDLGDIDQPTDVDDFQDAAASASKIIEGGVADLEDLRPPAAQKNDTDDLIDNFREQVDLLDELAAAARQGDSDTVAKKISSLDKLTDANADLAEELDASRCAMDPIFAAPPEEPPVTDPPVTDPPVTDPPVTDPPVTDPPVTDPPVTDPPAGESNKNIIEIADLLIPVSPDVTFAVSAEETVLLWQGLLDASTVVRAQPGVIAGVDVQVNGTGVARVFAFVADADLLAPNSVEDLIPIVSGGAATVPETIGDVPGISYVTSGNNFFLAAQDSVIVWTASPTREGMLRAAEEFFASILG